MTETGTDPDSHAFTQTITGSETFSLTESGNPGNGTFTRQILGSGTYTETMVVTIGGVGVTTTPSGNYSYGLDESADPWAGVFSQSADMARYGLLMYFTNVANTTSADSPGNMNFLPFGQTFVDPWNWTNAWRGAATGAVVGGMMGGQVQVGAVVGFFVGGFEAEDMAVQAFQQGVNDGRNGGRNNVNNNPAMLLPIYGQGVWVGMGTKELDAGNLQGALLCAVGFGAETFLHGAVFAFGVVGILALVL